jgi:hypothetical protein
MGMGAVGIEDSHLLREPIQDIEVADLICGEGSDFRELVLPGMGESAYSERLA